VRRAKKTAICGRELALLPLDVHQAYPTFGRVIQTLCILEEVETASQEREKRRSFRVHGKREKVPERAKLKRRDRPSRTIAKGHPRTIKKIELERNERNVCRLGVMKTTALWEQEEREKGKIDLLSALG